MSVGERVPVPTVDVIVPVYGKWELTRECLDAMRRQTVAHRVIVVDDAGPDDTIDRLKSEYPEVKAIRMERNSGFAAACNAGIRCGDAELVVLINNDVIAAPDMLEHLLSPFATANRLGSSTPLLLTTNGRIDAFGLAVDTTLAGFRRMNGAHASEWDQSNQKLLGAHGAAAALRRRALDEVGLLDERIFMYGEDLDLALRLAGSGWTSTAVGAAVGVHLGGGSVGVGSRKQRWQSGFGRGYLLRAYGVMKGRSAARAFMTESIVCVGDLFLYRDAAAFKGRIAGWRAGRYASPRPPVPSAVIETNIGFFQSL